MTNLKNLPHSPLTVYSRSFQIHETGVGHEGADVRETRFTFDAQGRQLTRTLPLGVPSFSSNATGAGVLDASGRIPAAFTPQPFTEYFWYNDLGQQVYHVSFEGRGERVPA